MLTRSSTVRWRTAGWSVRAVRTRASLNPWGAQWRMLNRRWHRPSSRTTTLTPTAATAGSIGIRRPVRIPAHRRSRTSRTTRGLRHEQEVERGTKMSPTKASPKRGSRPRKETAGDIKSADRPRNKGSDGSGDGRGKGDGKGRSPFGPVQVVGKSPTHYTPWLVVRYAAGDIGTR